MLPDDAEEVDEAGRGILPGPAEDLRAGAVGEPAKPDHLVVGVVVDQRLPSGHPVTQPGQRSGGQLQFGGLVERLEPAQLVVAGLAGGGVVHPEPPQVHPVVGGGLDVDVDLQRCRGHRDRAGLGAVEFDPLQQQSRAVLGEPQPLLAPGAVADQRQVALQQAVEVGSREVCHRGDPGLAEHRDLVDVQRGLRDPQAQVVGVEPGQARIPPAAPRALAVDHGDDRRRQVGVARRGLPGQGEPGGELPVVALQGGLWRVGLGLPADQGQHRLGQVEPDGHRAEPLDLVGAHHEPVRVGRREPDRLQHPVEVGQVDRVGPPVVPPVLQPGLDAW